jgi:hypothetical protein
MHTQIDQIKAALSDACDVERIAAPAPRRTVDVTASAANIVLASFNRGPLNDSSAEVIRWSLDTYVPPDRPDKPRRYISVRRWFRGGDGVMHPTREGITIRIGEVLVVLRALHKAAAMLSLNVEPSSPIGGSDA